MTVYFFPLCGYELVNSMLRRRISLSTIIGLKIPPIEGSNNSNRNMKIVKLSLTIEVQWLCGLKNCIYFKKCETYFKTDFKPPNQVQFSCHPKCKLCDLWKMILWQIFAMAFKNGWGEEWQFNKSKSRGHGRYQSITRQSATIWLHFRARRAGPSFCWKLTLFKNVFQVQTLWWCWWLVHSVEIIEIYFYAIAKYFVKAMYLPKMFLKSWFREIFFRWEWISCFSTLCVVYLLLRHFIFKIGPFMRMAAEFVKNWIFDRLWPFKNDCFLFWLIFKEMITLEVIFSKKGLDGALNLFLKWWITSKTFMSFIIRFDNKHLLVVIYIWPSRGVFGFHSMFQNIYNGKNTYSYKFYLDFRLYISVKFSSNYYRWIQEAFLDL